MSGIYDYLLSEIEAEFDPVRDFRSNARGRVSLLRHRQSGELFVFRAYRGNGEVYRGLLPICCPHLPRVLEYGERDGQVAVLEEYIRGDSLAYLLEGGCLPPAQAREIALHVCRGLVVLHGMGAVHRDIKPENVILCGDRAVLIDFDASRFSKRESPQDTRILGTTGYAAPEQYGIAQTDARTDIYALGVMLNLMLTGEHPSRRLAEGRLGHIVLKCTRIAPGKRYRSVRALMEAL